MFSKKSQRLLRNLKVSADKSKMVIDSRYCKELLPHPYSSFSSPLGRARANFNLDKLRGQGQLILKPSRDNNYEEPRYS